MAKQEVEPQIKQDEFSRIFDEYRSKIEEITRRTESNIRSLSSEPINTDDAIQQVEVLVTREAPENGSNGGTHIPDGIISRVQPETPKKQEEDRKNGVDAERQNVEESAEILYDAKRKAKQIIEEAEESAKKEAKKKTQGQVDKLIGKAKKEAEDIIARANQMAEKERDEVIAASKREVERLIKEITEKCRQESQAQATRSIEQAQEKAKKMLADVSASTVEINRLIAAIVLRARNTINEFETGLQQDTIELTRVITAAQTALEEVSRIAVEEKPRPAPQNNVLKNREIFTNPTLSVRLAGEKSNGKNGTPVLFSGRLEMKSVSVDFDYQYLKNMKKYLAHVPNVKYLQEYASEKEMSALWEVKEPLPLVEILNNIPGLDKVITEPDGNFSLIFKNT